MQNILATEWAHQISQLYDQANKTAGYTKVMCEFDSDPLAPLARSIRFEGLDRAMTATIELCVANSEQGLCMKPQARVGSSATFPGRLIQARAQLIAVTEVLDLLSVAFAQVENLTIWTDGTCPCDHCKGRGDQRGSHCMSCKGKGVR